MVNLFFYFSFVSAAAETLAYVDFLLVTNLFVKGVFYNILTATRYIQFFIIELIDVSEVLSFITLFNLFAIN